MRSVLFTVVLVGAMSSLTADDKKSASTNPSDKAVTKKTEENEPEFGPGSPAPTLKVAKWLKGEAVAEFANDKVYVVEFWATWCLPCIKAMPHLDTLARQHKDKGLVVVALTTEDPNNSGEAVAKFVKEKADKFDFRFAFCDDNTTWKAYMDAAQRSGIPCSFVIGRDGKLAFVGHPQDLDDVLPLVLDGTWRGKADADEYAKMGKNLEELPKRIQKDPTEALATLDKISTKYPGKASGNQFVMYRVMALLGAKKTAEAETVAKKQIEKMTESKDAEGLTMLGLVLARGEQKPEAKLVALGLASVDKAISLDGKNLIVLIMGSQAYYGAGNRAKAIEIGEQAIAVAPNEVKAAITEMVKKMKSDQPQDKK
jgi:thiol-disulfide isomerase/thioredoxin